MAEPAFPLDTAPAAEAARVDLWRRMTPAEKAARVAELTDTACRLSMAGLRLRHPTAAEPELLLRLAVLRLGPDMVQRAYAWPAPGDGP